ncbi:MAG: hypothetical protein CME61_09365 [Halobacteriovoraceae bacterium]|nr:hypothetical protein [Halobacteriovoraceae bacterium]
MSLVGREDCYFEANDPRAFELVKAGVPEVQTDRLHAMRQQASDAMRHLAATLRDDFRSKSLARRIFQKAA